jgi:AAA15 family ATPase/GTPase
MLQRKTKEIAMHIKSIEASNFKSLVDFRLELAKFNCLIGLNGSGKSTVLQFIDFLSQLVHGNMKGWLGERKWRSSDLKSKLTKKVNIDFCVFFSDEHGNETGHWKASYNPSKNRCTQESIEIMHFLLETSKDKVVISDCSSAKTPYDITFDYEGSILSALREELLPVSILECKKLFQDVKSLELLAPEYLRQRTRESAGTLGLGGQNLSAFLHEMGDQKRQELFKNLKKVYPQLQGLHAKPLRSGWKQIEINEAYEGLESGFSPSMTTEARHINDGMLRLMAILAELEIDNQFVLFDEIENGINPELVEFVIDRLVKARQQVLVTTHSPMILNYLDDQMARDGVIYLYKTPNGYTKSIPFFSIPSLKEKLKVMGPGEVFVDTNLTQLRKEIEEMPKEGA